MAGAQPPSTTSQPQSKAAIERGITRLGERITELEQFDLETVSSSAPADLVALAAAIKDTLIRCFGENTSTFRRLQSAAMIHAFPISLDDVRPNNQRYARESIDRSIALLKEAQRTLREDLVDAEHIAKSELDANLSENNTAFSRRVFVVHGHDEGARETVARFLMQLGFEPIILHEQANQGRTVMEKVEAHGQVGFAVVLLTPDDEGCAKGGTPEPRARQNVLLELGYFLGRLGRDKVCALKRGTLEIPSDFAGVVWESMEGSSWKQALGRELEAAGHEIDWNKVMRA
ncbi:TIR domain-containing protein [Pseudomonas sp. H11T01]|uniref:TIR domain-containing protein n=1 Tax=Pseudomonas sp. H11T01 TaxID=3402749 RepID=UPI003AC7BD48